MKGQGLKSILVVVFGLAAGLLLASQVNDFLRITYLPKDLPSQPTCTSLSIPHWPKGNRAG